jgi:hypothetical protein
MDFPGYFVSFGAVNRGRGTMLRKILAGVLIVALPVILLLSERDWVLSDQHKAVADVAAIPANASGALVSDLDRIVDYFGVHVPHPSTKAEQLYQILALAGRVPPAVHAPDYQRPRYGYSIREFSFLGMPFGWFSEYGYVVYTRDRWQLVEAPLNEDGAARLRKEIGRDLGAGFFFPFWAHAWGWLYVAGVALWGWLQFRWLKRQREEAGII